MKGRGDGVTAKGPDSRRVGSTTPKMQTPCAGFSKRETGIPGGTRCRVPGTWDPGPDQRRGPNAEYWAKEIELP
jgi:hypothetical protein